MTLMTLPVAASGTVAGWVLTAALTFLLIGLPLIYLLLLTFATDDDAIDRAVRDQVQYTRLKERSDAYAFGKDVYGVLDKPLVLEPLRRPSRPRGTSRRPRSSVGGSATARSSLPTHMSVVRTITDISVGS